MTAHSLVVDFSNIVQKRDFMQRIGSLSGLWEFRFKQRKLVRTKNQNDYYWAAIVEPFRLAQEAQGESDTKEECHQALALMFLRESKEYTSTVSGEIKKSIKIRSTTDLKIDEFSAYIEKCSKFLAEFFGIVVLTSEQYLGK